MQVTISATSIGGNAGPFNITDNFGTTIATGITRAQILAGYTVSSVNNSATSINLISSGVCTNTTNITIVSNPTVTYSFVKAPGLQEQYGFVFYNGSLTYLYSNVSSTTVTLSSAVQTIYAGSYDGANSGINVDYFLNNTFQTTYFNATSIQTPNITTSAGNDYRFDIYNGLF